MLTFLANPGLAVLSQPFGPFKFRGAHEPSGLALGWRRFSGVFWLFGHLDLSVGDGFTFFYKFVLKLQRARSELGDLSDDFLAVRRKQREASFEASCRSQ
ncbi:hypothetical protein COP1_023854 [Malus domestica]